MIDKIMNNERLKSTGVITLCLVLLFNPYVKMLDILPDFIAYFIAVKLLSDIAFKAPYFEEMRTALKRLGILSIIRLSALIPLAYMQSKTDTVDDTVTLLTFLFSVIEIVLAIGAINNFVKAIEYLSERTSATALYGPFKLKSGRSARIEELRFLTYVFVAVKCAGNFIPEMCLLSRTGIEGGFNPARLYPYLFISFFALTLLLGGIWLNRALAYLKHIKCESAGIFCAVEELVTEDRQIYIDNKKLMKKKKHALVCITVATFLNFEVTLTEFREINLLPTFISAILITVGVLILVRKTGKFLIQKISCGTYIAATLAKSIIQILFLIRYSYSDLLENQAAATAYKAVMLMAIVEFATFLFFIITFALSMSKYTDLALCREHLEAVDRGYYEDRRIFRTKAAIYSVIGVAVGALKLLNIIINSTINQEYVSLPDSTIGIVYYSDMPWLPLVISIAVLIHGFYAIHYFGAIKDYEEMKYAERSHI